MSSATFEKVLSSAVLTSCAVFSVLTLAFVPNQPKPLTAEFPSLLDGDTPSVEDINHRDSVIRHIGISIVVSVGAGIAAAELLRKWERSRELSLTKQQAISTEMVLQPTSSPDTALSNGFAQSNGFAKSLHRTANSGSPFNTSELEVNATSVLEDDRGDASESTALPLFLFQPAITQLIDDVNWFPLLQDGDTRFPELASALPLSEVNAQPLTHQTASRGQYQICRVYLPDAPDRLLAILFEGQYYRLVRTANDYEQACSVAAVLDQKGETVVMTELEARYAIWALEPEAFPEAIEPIGFDGA